MPDLSLILSLPIALLLGWWGAWATEKYTSRKRAQRFNHQYFQGLNYLLNEQPDKAIQVFLELAEVNEDTVETHMALGSLFRRRGEVDRAIRFHQNIIEKHGLNPEQRSAALLALGKDYMRAGLLDRAEQLFNELIDEKAHSPEALRHLLDIYQQEKEWQSALDQAHRLEQSEGVLMGETMAQFSCELAELARARGDSGEAIRGLRQARQYDPDCVRARFIRANLHIEAGEPALAMEQYEQIAELDPDYIPDLLGPYIEVSRLAGAAERVHPVLLRWRERYEGISLILKLTEFALQDMGPEQAGSFLIGELARRPSVRGLERLMELKSGGYLDPESSDEILRAVTSKLLDRQHRYRCSHCGFSGHTHHWQCPSCRRWSTTKTIKGVLGE